MRGPEKLRAPSEDEESTLESPTESLLGEESTAWRRQKRSRKVWLIHLGMGSLWATAFTLVALWARSLSSRVPVVETTSPLAGVVEYSAIRFSTGFDEQVTEYQGSPNDVNTAAWKHITAVGIVELSSQQQARLPDESVYFDKEKETYIGGIEMFHQLHCLDMLRREIYHDDFLLHPEKKAAHLDHCIDYLRQVLMCHGDIGILPFRLEDSTNNFKADFASTHQCRNFEAIRSWAVEHQAGNLTPQGG